MLREIPKYECHHHCHGNNVLNKHVAFSMLTQALVTEPLDHMTTCPYSVCECVCGLVYVCVYVSRKKCMDESTVKTFTCTL